MGELRTGVERLRHRGYIEQTDLLERWLGRVTQWFFGTRTFRAMTGEGGGSDAVDEDFAHRSMDGFGAFILGRNMFGPIRGPWPDEGWRGW